MQFKVLGPIQVTAYDHPVVVTAGRERALLALLLLRAPDPVPLPLLVEAVWGERPPHNARNQVQAVVSRLRKRFADRGYDTGRHIIVTGPAGYLLSTDTVDLDLLEFRRLVAEARAAARREQPEPAVGHYRAALALWRGPAFADVDSLVVRQAAAVLDEERVQAQEECIGIELAVGKAGELISELTELVREHPYREALQAARLTALYRAGRQTDALAANRDFRQMLADELGTEPADELQRLHRAILNRDPELDAPRPPTPVSAPTASPVPRELPADVSGFAGRADALAALDGLLASEPAGAPGPVVISAIAGTAGVGKTALAVHWGHQVADQFPDGQLYLNLRGYASGPPLRPIEALSALLRSLGIPSEQIPTDEAQAAALFRTKVTGQRVLVMLDNAGSVDQVRPLLPGSPSCLVLVTSRDRLSGLVARDGARRITLDVLTACEAYTLLTHLLGTERVDAEPEAVTELTTACAYLPLALRIAAAHIADRPVQTIASYVIELTTGDRLGALAADGDQESSVLAAFELSYQALPADAARLFRLLGIVPGPDFTPTAAAALADAPDGEVTRQLRRLVNAHLVEERSPDRYAFHDLLRLFAGRLARAQQSGQDGTAALTRLFEHYLQTANAAADLLYGEMPRIPVPKADIAVATPGFENSNGALAWLDAERANLVAAVAHAAEHGPHWVAWVLGDCIRGYLMRRQLTVDWSIVAESSLTAARNAGDPQGQAAAWHSISKIHARGGRYREANEASAMALELARQVDWTAGQASILRSRGIVFHTQGALDQAADCNTEALAIDREAGRLDGQASSLTNLGIIHRERGRLHSAADHYLQALAIDRRLGSIDGEADSLTNIGTVHRDLGRLDRSVDELARALAIHRQVGDLPGEAITMTGLALTYRDAGRLTAALEHATAGLTLASDIGARRLRIDGLDALGSVLLCLEQPDPALTHYQEAIELASRTGNRYVLAGAYIGLARVRCHLAQLSAAEAHLHRALELARATGYRVLEGGALTTFAEIVLSQGQNNQATEHAHRALASHRETGFRLGEAHTLLLLGRIRHAERAADAAERHWDQAATMLAKIGAPVPERPW